MKKRNFKQKFAKWCDEWKLAISGVVLATRDLRFVAVGLVSFLLFGTLMNLLANGLGSIKALFLVSFEGKIRILGNAFLGIFGVNKTFGDWVLVFFISLLQGILIGLLVLVWKKRKESSANAQNIGIVTGLAVLGSGCPTCGTTLLAPLIGAISSTGGYALSSTLSWGLMIVAIIVALLTLKKIGLDAYAIIISERYKGVKK